MSETLTTTEAARLEACEEVISEGMATFIAVGNALAEIRDCRLYRAADYDTFDAYLAARWDMTRQRASQLVIAADIARQLSTSGLQLTSERQARAFGELAPALYPQVAEVILATADGRVTGTHVNAVVEVVKQAAATGMIEPAHGVQVQAASASAEEWRAAVTLERRERDERQRTHTAPVWSGEATLYVDWEDAILRLNIPIMSFDGLGENRTVKVVIYEKVE